MSFDRPVESVVSRRVVQIVPRRNSAPCGVGDYAARLAAGLKADFGVETTFIAGTPVECGPPLDDGSPTLCVARRSSSALVDCLERVRSEYGETPVILHVSGYGYAKRGAPVWLAEGVRRWRAKKPSGRWLGVFHELYATGPITNSSFWLGPLQKRTARRLWHSVDVGLTPTGRYSDELLRWRPDARNCLIEMAVPSTVGEPVEVPPLDARPQKAVVFGRPGIEAEVYGRHRTDLVDAIAALGIIEIVDIGIREAPPPVSVAGARVRPLGRLTAEQVCSEFLDCRYGFLSYDPARLGKSTIFSGYAAHGVVPVCLGSNARPDSNLIAGEDFLCPPLSDVEPSRLPAVQTNLRSWYGRHDVAALSQAVGRLLMGVALILSASSLPLSLFRVLYV
jgi:hypothetical protein